MPPTITKRQSTLSSNSSLKISTSTDVDVDIFSSPYPELTRISPKRAEILNNILTDGGKHILTSTYTTRTSKLNILTLRLSNLPKSRHDTTQTLNHNCIPIHLIGHASLLGRVIGVKSLPQNALRIPKQPLIAPDLPEDSARITPKPRVSRPI